MQLLVDRPYSDFLEITEGKGAGKKVLAHLGWGADNDPRPAYVLAVVDRDGTDFIIDQIDGPFENQKEANAAALACATAWYDRGNS